jgi:hypothetical protein
MDDNWVYGKGSDRTRLAFVVDPKTKAKAERIAQSESRTLSGWLRKIVTEKVAETGRGADEIQISNRP